MTCEEAPDKRSGVDRRTGLERRRGVQASPRRAGRTDRRTGWRRRRHERRGSGPPSPWPGGGGRWGDW